MAQPIRWDNINGGGLSEASRPLDSAAGLFQNAFSGLRDVLKERESVDAANWQNTKANNTTSYLDAVAKLTNPDDVRAAQKQGGALDQMRQQFGYQIDANAVRGAADTRVAALQDQAQKEILYKHSQLDEATSNDVQAFQTARLKGDKAGMDTAMSSYMAKGGRDPSSLLKYADERDWLVNERGMKLENHQASMDQVADGIRHNKASEDIQRQGVSVQAQQVRQQGDFQNWQMNTATEAANAAKASAKVAAYRKELVDSGNLYAKEGVWDGSQASDFMEALTKNKIGDDVGERSAIIERMNKIARDGITIKDEKGRKMVIHEIPVAAARAAMLGSTDQMVNRWNQGYANEMKSNLEAILQGRGVQDGALTNKMVEDLRTYRSMLTESTANPQQIRPVMPSTQVPGRRK